MIFERRLSTKETPDELDQEAIFGHLRTLATRRQPRIATGKRGLDSDTRLKERIIEKAGAFYRGHDHTAWPCMVPGCMVCSGAVCLADRRPTNIKKIKELGSLPCLLKKRAHQGIWACEIFNIENRFFCDLGPPGHSPKQLYVLVRITGAKHETRIL